MRETRLDLATLCVHAGEPRSQTPDPGARLPAAHVAPIHQQSVFDFDSIEASEPGLSGEGYAYRRHGLPNDDELAAAVAALEGAEAGIATSSGSGAIVASVLSICGSGDKVVVQRDAYGGTRAIFDRDLRRFGVEAVYADAYDPDALEDALDGARLALVETLSNPLLGEVDVAELVRRCRSHGALLLVDSTFSTPLRDRPLAAGADLVVHSATKFLGGHHDLTAGVACGGNELLGAARGVAMRSGLLAAPLDAWLAVRGLRTLEVRMRRAWESAAEIARRLERHEAVGAVYSARRCALVTLDVGDYERASRVVRALELITLSPSLGGVTTTVSHPATSSHRALSARERAAVGIGDGLLRLSVGLEGVEDVWQDLARALEGGE